MLSYQQGILQFHPPLTLAETASIFGEMIVFRDLLAKAPSDEDRLAMLMSKIDDIINSVVRQCSFDAFEAKVHSARAAGTLTPDEMTTAGGALRLSTRPTLNLLLLLFVFLFLNNVHRAPRRFTW